MYGRPPLRVIIAGGGLAGLSAAYDLGRHGLDVHVVEARGRLGGRVHTIHDADGLHVEAGGEFIDQSHDALRGLAASLRVPLTRVLRGGFGLLLDDGTRVTRYRSGERPWRRLKRRLRPLVDAYRKAGASWDTAAAAAIARHTVEAVVPRGSRPWQARAFVESLRGFYVADPHDLSALVLVEQLLGGEPPGRTRNLRVVGGNDRLVHALSRRIRRRGRIELRCAVEQVTQHARGVRVAVVEANGRRRQLSADYAILAVPPPLALACHFDPPLPPRQRAALAALTLGAGTKVSLRFERAWWRRVGQPRAFGTNLPCGAVWESAEEQRRAVLTLLAGASASAPLAAIAGDADALMASLRPLGAAPRGSAAIVGSAVSWEREPWSGGAYAVFGPAFDPRERRLLAAPHGRVFFAGEHASERWQGFMNGAVESGQAAARDIIGLAGLADAVPRLVDR